MQLFTFGCLLQGFNFCVIYLICNECLPCV